MEKDNLIVKLIVLFYICSFLGYIYELILCYIYNKKLFSHGFLKGPWLPIYGTGSLLIMFLNNYKNNPLKIFFLSFIITGTLEGVIGLLLLKIFKMRLWDYTGNFLNIGGFVCFLSAFCFGIGGLLIIYLIYPLIEKIVSKVNISTLEKVLSFISLIFGIDLIASLLK